MPVHKHEIIFRSLFGAIQDGRFAAGGRLPSETALARKHRVSRPTAAQALRELERLELIERRPGSGTFVRAAKSQAHGSFALVSDGLDRTEILEPITREIGRAAQARGWSLMVAVHAMEKSPDSLIRAWVDQGIAGIFFAPVEHNPIRTSINRAFAERVIHHRLRLVLLDRDLAEYPERSAHDVVGIDDFLAAVHLGLHLATTDRRRIVFVARPDFPPTTDLRFAGLKEAAQRADGMTVSWHVGDPADSKWIGRVIRRTRCDGVVCSNDATAAAVLQSLQKLKVRVPEQLALAGFDDVTYASLLSPPLTTMRQPCAQLAETAVEAMISRMEHPGLPPRRILVEAPLVVRGSTAPRS
jgi:DNA-binding LacI/PurR family transcriptional regulator